MVPFAVKGYLSPWLLPPTSCFLLIALGLLLARRLRWLGGLLAALGLLSGTIGPDRVFSGDDQRRDNPRFSVSNRQKAKDFAEAIRPVAARHGASIAQVGIAWTLAQPGVTFALCGARNPAQALDNARAGTLRLGTEDIAAIDAAIAAKLASMDG